MVHCDAAHRHIFSACQYHSARWTGTGGSLRAQESGLPGLSTITQEIELIPVESLNQCEKIGSEIMKGGKLSKFLKGYKSIPGLL